jgi:hypothetical protein
VKHDVRPLKQYWRNDQRKNIVKWGTIFQFPEPSEFVAQSSAYSTGFAALRIVSAVGYIDIHRIVHTGRNSGS